MPQAKSMLTLEHQAALDHVVEQSRRWGCYTLGQLMDKLNKQHDALQAIADDPAVPAFVRTLARGALGNEQKPMNAADVLRTFPPLPEDEAAALRTVMDDSDEQIAPETQK